MSKKKRKNKINFLLENTYYQKLHLLVYLFSVLLIVLIYFLIIKFSSNKFNIIFTGTISLCIGLFLVYKKDEIVKNISEYMHEKKRRKLLAQNKVGLRTTLKKIVPKRDIKLSIETKGSLKNKFASMKPKILKKNKNKEDYIEIK